MLDPFGRWLNDARHCFSPHQDARPVAQQISLLVIHNISLPAGLLGAPYIEQLFLGCLQPDYPSLKEVQGLRVSAHLLIRRDGQVVQYVPFDRRAWHAGVSQFDGQQGCNDFSIGIELEGTDDKPYDPLQYQSLVRISQALMVHYPAITLDRIRGHNEIAPGRKTDPGAAFDWPLLRAMLAES